jgi:hypothetical protein
VLPLELLRNKTAVLLAFAVDSYFFFVHFDMHNVTGLIFFLK